MDKNIDDLRTEWETFVKAQEARGVCPHSGETFAVCKESCCDCFDYPDEGNR